MTFYGVWEGKKTGIYTDWTTCSNQIKGHKGAKYKKLAAKTQEAAEKEFSEGYKPNTKKEKKEKKEAREKTQVRNLHKTGELVYFCDGACKNNPGSSGAGVAMYRHGELNSLYYGNFTVDGSNNVGELQSMIYCLDKIKKDQPFAALIYADSMYTINCITKWAKGWKENNWLKKDNKAPENLELVKEAFYLYESVSDIVKISHVKAHNNEEGNELADRMAITASNTQAIEWTKYESLDIPKILKIEHNKT